MPWAAGPGAIAAVQMYIQARRFSKATTRSWRPECQLTNAVTDHDVAGDTIRTVRGHLHGAAHGVSDGDRATRPSIMRGSRLGVERPVAIVPATRKRHEWWSPGANGIRHCRRRTTSREDLVARRRSRAPARRANFFPICLAERKSR
jgi:hypothetical protein